MKSGIAVRCRRIIKLSLGLSLWTTSCVRHRDASPLPLTGLRAEPLLLVGAWRADGVEAEAGELLNEIASRAIDRWRAMREQAGVLRDTTPQR